MGKENDPSQEIQDLEKTIADLEAQRTALGDATVDTAVRSLREKQTQLDASIPQQQRKIATILFLDIVGSTQLTQSLDPEEKITLLESALLRLSQPVIQHGGHITRYQGDGFKAVFGLPTARENDPEHAVRAGLEIQSIAGEIACGDKSVAGMSTFQVRIGIDTGMVVAGGVTEGQDTVDGAAVVMSARLEAAAQPGGILISHNTYRHVRGLFDVQEQEPLLAKGFNQPVRVYRVLQTKPRAFRVVTRGVEGIETPMVGRTAELKMLQDAMLNAIEESEGQMVTIIGEAGVGKSRLLYEFQNWLELLPPPAVRFFEGRAYPEALHTPCGMLRHLFASRFQIQDDDRGEVAREKLYHGLEEAFGAAPDGEMRVHLLGQWLGYDFSSSPHLKGVLGDAEQLRNRGRMYLAEYFNRISSQEPVAVFLEDIHWADDSSLDVLNWLGERLPRQRVMVLCAARPTLLERRPYWGEGLSYHHCLRLEPLSKRESRQLVQEILKLVEQVPSELRELVVEGAEGNPFYIEELVKMLIEDGIIVKGEDAWQIRLERLAEIQVPSTLTEVLQARLDSLSADERTVLQQASVVGRLFWDDVVAHIQAAEERPENMLPEMLIALRSRELIYRHEESAFANAREYIFKHDILREVTYKTVLKRLRKIYHGLVADWLIAQGDERAAEFSGLIAEHLHQAGRDDEAGQYFLHAGETALQSYANGEAETHFRKATELLIETPQRAPCLAGLGEALGRQGRGQEAVEIFNQTIELYFKEKEYDRVARLYTRLAQVLWYIDNKQAWKACQEGLERLAGAPEGPGLAHLLAEGGRNAYFQTRPAEEVLRLCQRAIKLADDIGELEAGAEARITLAICTGKSDHDQSCQLLQDVIGSTEANGLWDQAARAHLDLGVLFIQELENIDLSYQHQLRAIEISAQVGNINSVLLGLDNLYEYAIEIGKMRAIEDTIETVLRSCSISPAQATDFSNAQKAKYYYFRGEWVRAVEFLHERLSRLRQSGVFQLIVMTNLYLIVNSLEQNRFMEMTDLAEAEEALQENIKAGDWFPLETRYCRVVLPARQKQFARARQLLGELFHPLIQAKIRPAQIYCLAAETELLLAEQNWDGAVAACRNLVPIYQEIGYRWRHARALIDLGDALAKRNQPSDLEEAQTAYRQSLELFTEMGASGYIQVLEKRLNI